VPLLIGVYRGEATGLVVALVYIGYFAGLLGAATVFWLLQSAAHLATGRYVIGALGGTCLYGAVAPVVSILDGEPTKLGSLLMIAAVPGGLVGPAVALHLDE
jgi:hypothetical protein